MAPKRPLPKDVEKREVKNKKFKCSIKMRLREACLEGDIETVKQCMKFKFDVNERMKCENI